MRWRTVLRRILYFGQISMFTKGHYSQKKNESEFPVDIHIYTTTKFREILFSGFRGVALTNCFSSIFHFGQISKLEKGVILRKNPVDMHIYALCPSLLQSFGQISKLKKSRNCEKKLNQNFLWICTSTWYAFTITKFHEIQRSCADKLFH